MATVETVMRDEVRPNDLDWEILSVMADGKRYTPAHLYNDVDELAERGDDYVRRRVRELHDDGLINRVGTSSMYVISDWGEAAVEIRAEGNHEVPPKEFMQLILERAADSSE